MEYNKKDLVEIAKEARQSFIERAIPKDKLKSLYLNYNSTDNIDSFLKKAERLFPKLNCGLASVYLKDKIPQAKIINGKYNTHNHTFLMLKNTVIDITADQYKGPKIYVGELKYPYSLNQLENSTINPSPSIE